MNDLENRLSKCFAAVFPHVAAESIPRASAKTIEKWDSLALVVLTSLVEEEFKIQIAPDDLDHFDSYPRILEYLRSKTS
jgi:acyl carrier protein